MSSAIIHIPGKPRICSKLGRNDVLWRYVDAAKFLDFIHNKTLFFCRGDQFEDKYEGAFTDSIRHAIEQSYQSNNIDFTYEQFRQRLRERVFINCWHMSPNDSMAMWSIYGKSECSVAITTTVAMLHNAIEEQSLDYDIAIEKVNYVKYWRDPKLDLVPYSKVFAHKNIAYEFEKEVRVLIDRFDAEFNADIEEKGMSIKVDLKTLLCSIVIAPEAPQWFVNLVGDVCNFYKVEAPVKRSLLAKEPV